MTTYKEYKQGLKEQRERIQAIRNEVFSDKVEKLETDLVRISNGDVYKIIPRFGTKLAKLESLRKLWQARIKNRGTKT